MNFNQLNEEQKEQLHKQTMELTENLGGVSFFLQMIEDIKKEKPHPLLNKSCVFHFSKGKLNWNKQLFKESINLHFIDKRNDTFYQNIDDNFIKNKIGVDFEI